MQMLVGTFYFQYCLANKLYIWVVKFAKDRKLGQKILGNYFCTWVFLQNILIAAFHQLGLFEKKKKVYSNGQQRMKIMCKG